MCRRKLKRVEDVSQLKTDPFALHSNYSLEICLLYAAHGNGTANSNFWLIFLINCQNLFSFALLTTQFYPVNNQNFYEEAVWGVLLNVLSLLSQVLIKRGAYFETRRNFDELISKSKNVISCQFPKVLETRIWGHKVTKAV